MKDLRRAHWEETRVLYSQGLSSREIAERLGINPSSVVRSLHAMGVPLRKREDYSSSDEVVVPLERYHREHRPFPQRQYGASVWEMAEGQRR